MEAFLFACFVPGHHDVDQWDIRSEGVSQDRYAC